jgi:hypothetical protein
MDDPNLLRLAKLRRLAVLEGPSVQTRSACCSGTAQHDVLPCPAHKSSSLRFPAPAGMSVLRSGENVTRDVLDAVGQVGQHHHRREVHR